MTKLDTISFDDALSLALKSAQRSNRSEVVVISQALGRIVAEKIICQKNLPSFDNSAMDGFAFKHEDVGSRVRVASTIFAGDKPTEILQKGECYKIMTGAQVPSDADTIVPIENCLEVSSESVLLSDDIKKGSSLRKKGEEQMVGDTLIEVGERLTPAHIAMLSAQGIVALSVYTKLDIAVVSTGDEIREPWESSSEDEIYNANAFGITALLAEHGFDSSYLGSIPDDREATVEFISTLSRYDVVITTGGISMGDADFLYGAFVQNGLKKLFHGVNVKPGRPTMMGIMGSTFIMAMPGNPLTTMLNIRLLSIPILRKMQGYREVEDIRLYAKNSKPFRVSPSKSNMILGSLIDGRFVVTRDNRYGSGMLTPLMESNAVALLPRGRGGVDLDETINVVIL